MMSLSIVCRRRKSDFSFSTNSEADLSSLPIRSSAIERSRISRSLAFKSTELLRGVGVRGCDCQAETIGVNRTMITEALLKIAVLLTIFTTCLLRVRFRLWPSIVSCLIIYKQTKEGAYVLRSTH